MKLQLSWLAERIALDGTVEEICDLLTGAGIETEVAEDQRPSWDGVITARLDAVDPHPDADRLTVTRPTDGSQEWTVVCGATNHKAGDVVALATVGTVLPGDFKIKKSKIRGQLSQGMLCSEKELGLSGEADGILVLPPDTPLGRPLAEVLEAGDVVLDVAPTANRGDCLSVLGLARELSAVTGWPLTGRRVQDEQSGEAEAETLAMPLAAPGMKAAVVGEGDLSVRVELEAVDGCPRYSAAVMSGVGIAPSPQWMQDRLQASGVRPINNVVDCTNFVMLELGNPLHAFDRRTLRGGRVVIRRAGDGELARTLDGGEHRLLESDLVIADAEGVVALAGVMGGENSEVRDDTVSLFLESAHFEPMTVRKTAHRCKLNTESSYRFARGVDPELPRLALARLIELLEQTSGGRVVGDTADLHPDPHQKSPVTLRFARVSGLLGMSLPSERVLELLARDGLEILEHSASELVARPPSYRFDLEREVDLLEEVARLEGYENIEEVVPARELRVPPRKNSGPSLQAIREALMGCGLSEAIHFSFIDPAWLADLGLGEDHPWRARAVSVSNPLSEVGSILRPTLLPSLLRCAARNRAMGSSDLRLFELRRVFSMRDDGFEGILDRVDGRPSGKSPVIERNTVCGVLVGQREPPTWASKGSPVNFYDAKACCEALAPVVGWRGWDWRAEGAPDFLDPRESASLEGAGGRGSAGWVGRLAVPVLRAFDLDMVAYAFELDLDRLAPKRAAATRFVPFSRFPMVERDLAFVVPEEHSAQWVLDSATKLARKGSKGSFLGAEVFDVYRGKGIPAGARSLALRFRFRASDRTLEDAEVDRVMGQIEKQLSSHDGISLRA